MDESDFIDDFWTSSAYGEYNEEIPSNDPKPET